MTKRAKKIEKERWYTLSEMVEARLFNWCKDITMYRRYIFADRGARNMLKTVIIGSGTQRRYKIKGENIINYIVNVEKGIYEIEQKKYEQN